MLKLKIFKLRHKNPQTKKEGFSARVITNGKATYEDVVAEACRNTTMNKAETKAAIELFMESVARVIKQGYIVDLGPIGTLYPSCSSGWTEKEEDLLLSKMKLKLNYRPTREMSMAFKGATLQWAADKDDTNKKE